MTLAQASPPVRAPSLAVRLAALAEQAPLARTLARAFDQDPMINWLLRQDAGRARAFRRFFNIAIGRMAQPHNLVFTTASLDGAALWLPPGKWRMGLWRQLQLLPAMASSVGYRRVPGVMAGISAFDQQHPREAHYYLFLLGVEPACQGKGVGSALLGPVLARCDAEGMPAYLETANPRNLPLYERHGFRVQREFTVPRGGPLNWLMWREARV
ncbi:MAG TPA: GNAT family N-acetyltransferase [Dehalococcoidia bacterium]|nr:GNAT family N-acetyltransferase [Dehalococcoidia bacterium]